jgi:hypothetical protein
MHRDHNLVVIIASRGNAPSYGHFRTGDPMGKPPTSARTVLYGGTEAMMIFFSLPFSTVHGRCGVLFLCGLCRPDTRLSCYSGGVLARLYRTVRCCTVVRNTVHTVLYVRAADLEKPRISMSVLFLRGAHGWLNRQRALL